MEGCDKLSQVNVRQTYDICMITMVIESERKFKTPYLYSLAITPSDRTNVIRLTYVHLR